MKIRSRYKLAVRNFERAFIMNAVENFDGDLTKAAVWLGLDRAYLVKRVQRYRKSTAL